MPLPNMRIGTQDAERVDWRAAKAPDAPDDDAPRPADPDVIAMLGFDPAELDDDDSEGDDDGDEPPLASDEWNESAHKREGDGKFAAGGGSSKATDNPNFTKWFGSSHVVGENGDPRVVYHGTGRDTGDTMSAEKGAWFSEDPALANEYANGGEAGNIVPAYLKIERPIEFRHAEQRQTIGNIISHALEGHHGEAADLDAARETVGRLRKSHGDSAKPLFEFWRNDPDVSQLFRDLGYDGIKVAEKSGGAATWAALSPGQVKSATGNKGTFDPKSHVVTDEWNEAAHKRGQPGNAGQFASGGAQAAPGSSEGKGEASHGNPATSLIAQHEASTPRDPAAQVALGAEIAAKVGASYRVADARQRLQRSVATSDYESEGGHMTEEGHWTEQRSRLHEKLLRDIFTKGAVERATPEKGARPTVTILGGRGGSGKSWLTGPNGPVDASKTIVIDADHFKTQLPEYQGWNAADMHEESSYLVEKAAGIAMALGCNVVFDATMRSAKSAAERIEQFAKAGYDAHGFYMFAAPRTACERAMKRFVGGGEKGRFVPPEVVLGNVDNERNFDAVIPNLKKWAVFDNDSGAGPKFVAGSKE